MSFLVVGDQPLKYSRTLGGVSFKPSGWEVLAPWTTKARMEAEEREQKRQKLVTKEEQKRLEREQALEHEQERRRAQAAADLQDQIKAKIQQVENSALTAAEEMEAARELAVSPELQGDPILDDLEEQIADMEQAVVQIQAGTVVDVATFDTHALAVSYSDAQAAFVAMEAIRNRAEALVQALQERIDQLKKERIRVEQLRRERERAAERERRRAEQREQQRQRMAKLRAEEAARRQRMQIMKQVRQLDQAILEEKRALRRLRSEVEEARRQAAAQRAQAAQAAAKEERIGAIRSGFERRGVSMGAW